MITEDEHDSSVGSTDGMERLREIERQRSHLWTTAFVTLVAVSLVVVVMSFWVDVFPDTLSDAFGFPGARFAFLMLSVAFMAYALQRERDFRMLTRALVQQNALAAKLAEQDRIRADLIARATHELKTPLTSVLGYATILRKRETTLTSGQRLEFIEVMERQGKRILELIDEMLQSARDHEALKQLDRVLLDLPSIVKRVTDEFATGREREIEVHIPDYDLGLYGDPNALEHILTNLLDNALKYSPHDSVVSVGISEGDGSVLITVSDEGTGIAPEDLSRIFERFRQGAAPRGHASVGLGLYIVKNLVEAHGGTVWADSELGKGTTFTVALPRRRRG